MDGRIPAPGQFGERFETRVSRLPTSKILHLI